MATHKVTLVYGAREFSFGWQAGLDARDFGAQLSTAVKSVTGLQSLQGLEMFVVQEDQLEQMQQPPKPVAEAADAVRFKAGVQFAEDPRQADAERPRVKVTPRHIFERRLGGSPERPPVVHLERAEGSGASAGAPAVARKSAVVVAADAPDAATTAPVRARFQKKGGNQLQFIRQMAMDKDPAGLRGAPSNRRITMEEVRQHNTSGDLWMVLQGRVFNMTPYVDFHPGGKAELMRSAGGDGTALFNEIHSWISLDMVERLQVGLLGCSPASSSTSGPPSRPPASRPEGPEVALHPSEWRPFPLVSSKTVAADCVLMRFDIGAGRVSGLRPGQHVNVRVRSRGHDTPVQRLYTPVSDTEAVGYLELLVKVYPNGKVGPALAALRPEGPGAPPTGDAVEIQGPFGNLVYLGGGRFAQGSKAASTVATAASATAGAVPAAAPATAVAPAGPAADSAELRAGHVVMLAAGSGLTPMLQLLRPIIREWQQNAGPRVSLVFCNRREVDAIYREDLERLAADFGPSRFRLRFLLSQPPGAESPTWPGSVPSEVAADIRWLEGRISDSVLAEAIGGSAPDSVGAPAPALMALSCGPEGFDAAVSDGLLRLGVPRELVHVF